MASPTDEGVRFHPAESDSRDSHSSSPPLVSKVTTQHAVGPPRRRDEPLGPAPRGGVCWSSPRFPALACRAGAGGRRVRPVLGRQAPEGPGWGCVVVVC